MAMKTDMNKTYYKVEWIFIEELLSKMGFDHHKTQLMIEFISLVQYIVLLNVNQRDT